MEALIVFVGMAPVLFDGAAATLDQAALGAQLASAPAADEPAVVVLGPAVLQPLALARTLRLRWQACELMFVTAAGDFDALRAQLARAPMIGPHWSALAAGDAQLRALLEDGMRYALRRARLRTTLDRANVRLAGAGAARQIDDSQYRRLTAAGYYLSSFLAQTPDGIVGLDAGLQVIHWNDSAARQWDMPQRRALSLRAPALPFWSDSLAAAVQAVLAGSPSRNVESRHDTAAGAVQMEFGVSGVRDDAGRLIGVSLVIRDSTERQRKLDRERLREREQAAEVADKIEARRRQLFDMFELAPGFIAVTSGPEHVFDMANRAYKSLFGERAGRNATVAAMFPEPDGQAMVALRDQVYASGEPYVGKAQRIVARDGDGALRERYIDFVYQPWRDEAGAVVGIFCQGHDVTEQTLLRDGLLTHQAELEALVARRTQDLHSANLALLQSQKLEAIGKLTGGVAHDFNNILQVIGANLDLMGLERELPASVRKRLAGSTAAVERAARLSSQLLAFARRQPLQPVPTDAASAVREMGELLGRALGEAVDVHIDAAPDLWNTLADRHQLENVILNLALNARDAMGGRGALTIDLANVELDAAFAAARSELQAGQYVLLAVSDTGAGMSAEVLRHAFEPFYTTRPEGEGTGLGLSMAYGFVKQSGGHIAIYSEPGEGTTVRIYLPRCIEAAYPMAQPGGGDAPGGSETILVVEDDAAVRISVIDLLKGLGYAVLSAYDAESALAMLEGGIKPDLLFTDVVMPGKLRSPELARHARRLVPGIAVLFTSGYTQNAIVHAGRLDEGVELLSKPYRRADLARKVRQMFDARAAQSADEADVNAVVTAAVDAVVDTAPPDTVTAAPQRVVVVEDNEDAREMLHELLSILGYTTLCFGSADGVLEALRADDILLTDVTLPGQSGLELAQLAHARLPTLRVVFSTGRNLAASPVPGKILLKPFSLEQLEAVLV